MKTAIYHTNAFKLNTMKQGLLSFRLLFLFMLILSVNQFAWGQILIDPTGNGGFETGTTMALNGWSETAGTNRWVVNTGATGFSGARCVYISNTTSGTPANTYTITTSSVSHFFRNVTVPSNAISGSVVLSFNWKCFGETTTGTQYDYFRVWLVPTSFSPVAGTQVSATGTAPTGRIQLGTTYNLQSEWQTVLINIPDAYINTSFRLVFEWRNDNSTGTAPSAAIDNISLTYRSSVVVGKITGTTTVACGGTTTLSSPVPTTSNGTVTTLGNLRTTTFTSAGTTTLGENFEGDVEVLVVAGGGGGGQRHAGGGGAGGVIYNPSFALTANPTVTVGGGGAGSTGAATGTNGGNSVFASISATGGGGGGTNGTAGAVGGSGGGGSNGATGGNGTAGQGNRGGNQGTACCNAFGAGGGGAGAAGINSAATAGTIGGVGRTFNISGANVSYGGGGGGGTGTTTQYLGGVGGGGAGGRSSSLNGSNGTANTGGGGGGGGANGTPSGNGGNGGSGIVIVRYLLPTGGTWSSSNDAVATVNSSGVVSGVSQGTAIITYTATNGSLSRATSTTVTVGACCTPPTAFSVTGGGTSCAPISVAVGLANSQSNVSYQLKRNSTNIGSPVAGTGSAISFGNQTLAGTYTVDAIGTGGGFCTTATPMTGSVVVTDALVPNATRNAPTGQQCSQTLLNFSAAPTGGNGSYSYSWSVTAPGGTSASPLSGSSSTFAFTPTNNTGNNQIFTVGLTVTSNGASCTQSFNPTINSPSSAPTGITSSVNSLCAETLGLVTLTSDGGTTGFEAEDVWYEGACSNDAYTQEWATQPFSLDNTTVNSISNGILSVTSGGTNPNDPMMFMSGLGSFDPAIYRYINIRYRVTAGTAGGVEIFFYNTAHNFAVGGETGYGALISDGNWRTLSVDMWQDPDYLTGGNILGWRYDWATAGGVTMELDFITLSDRPIIGVGNSITVNPTATTTYFTNKKGACNTTTCFSKEITVAPCNVPPCANNLLPTNGVSNQPTNIQLSWDAVSTALGYRVFFGTDNPPATEVSTQTGTTYTPSGLVDNTTYFWRIVPANNVGDATSCTVQSFTTYNPCGTVPNITSCGGGAAASMSGVGGGWNATGNGQERLYTFTASHTGNYRIRTTAASGGVNYHFKALSAGCNSTGWTSIGSTTGIGQVGGTIALTQGVEYYILLDAQTTSATSQTFVIECPPVVSSYTPAAACRDEAVTVTITGLNFNNISSISFGAVGAPSFTVTNSTSINVTHPVGNTNGAITVNTNWGSSGTSATSFVMNEYPTFTTQPSNITICAGTGGNFSVVPQNPSGISYQWQFFNGSSWNNTNTVPAVFSGHTTDQLSVTAVPVGYNGYLVRCIITRNGCPTNSNTAQLNVDALSVAGTVNAVSSVCGNTNTTFTATPNTGTFERFEFAWNTPSGYSIFASNNPYNWAANNDGNTLYVRSVVKNGQCPEAFSTPVQTFVEYRTPTAPDINSAVVSGLPCIGNRNITIGAVTSATSYVWLLDNNTVSGQSNATATINFPTATSYDIKVRASNSCGTSGNSASLPITIYPTETPDVSITSNVGLFPFNICDAVTTIDFSLTAIQGGGAPSANGTAPTYVWKLNGIPVGTNTTYANTLPQNGDEITVEMTSGATCIGSNPRTVASNMITVICDMICEGSTGWAKFNPGSDGLVGSVDKYEVSIDGGTTWVNTYTPDIDGKIYINTAGGARSVKIRTSRGDNASCESDKNTYTVWNIAAPNASGYALGDYVWTGKESTSWNSGGTNLPDSNWLVKTAIGLEIATTLPTTSNNVFIPAKDPVCVLNDAVVDITANTKDIKVYTGANLTVSSSNIMNVAGNWIGEGNFTPTTGTVNIVGATNSTIKSGASTNKFYYLNINKTNDANTVTLVDNIEVTNKVDVTKGEFVVPTNIVGKVKKFELKTGATKLNIQNQGQLRVNE
jgi:hypothetical protein